MKAFILLALFAVAFAAPECGEHEHMDSCGTSCPPTCDNYKNPPPDCEDIDWCFVGCQCDDGYLRNAEKKCVKPEECPASAPQTCGQNARYNFCGSACPLTCENHLNPPKICPAMCVIGCECDKGFVKTADGQCIKPEECPNHVRPVQKSCDEPGDPGTCMGYFPAWYFDTNFKECREFVYGGCQGNGNRYDSEEECIQNCAS